MEMNMKKAFTGTLALLLLSSIVTGKGFLSRETFMNLEKAEKKWGAKPFDPKEFRNGNQSVRATMAVGLIKSQRYVGKPISFVREELGEWDGYFESDEIPAFLVESKDKGSKEAWEILFLVDKTGRHIAEVRIHKNCCD